MLPCERPASSTNIVQSSSGSTSTRRLKTSPPLAHNLTSETASSSRSMSTAAFGIHHSSRPQGRPDEVSVILANLGHPSSVMKLIEGKNITTRDGLLAELRREVHRIRSDLGLGPWREDHNRNHCVGKRMILAKQWHRVLSSSCQMGQSDWGISLQHQQKVSVQVREPKHVKAECLHSKSVNNVEDTASLDKFENVPAENAASGSLQVRRMNNVCLLDLGELPVLEYAGSGGLGRN